ncbi:MAG: hypothetical protein LAP87_00780 [Acidobacteriia bacterium]|nr:hypothetical protein [Terriglobia bacterium]
MNTDITTAALKLLAYCRANDWAGYEPYDALNSRVLAALPILDRTLPRLVFTQALKRSPLDIRRLLLIGKTQNPKAIAVFLSAFVKLSKLGVGYQAGDIEMLLERLIALRSPSSPYWCWGYSFPWQMRRGIVPRWAPNLVCTYFAADALLSAYEQCRDPRCLDMAVSAAEYMLNELYWTDGASVGFSYPLPGLRGQVHNANFLAAALLCRVYKQTGDEKFVGPALRIARYSAGKQHADGSWDYGEAPSQQWNDNFHTGFNLCALRTIGQCAGTEEFESCLRRGFGFFRAHFFREDGAVRYFSNHTYPIDAHCVAQSIITLLELKDLDPAGNIQLTGSVFRWAMKHLWDERGFFYYRVLRFCTIRTSYMRWTQAWMFLALSTLLSDPDLGISAATVQPSTASVEVSA